MLGRTHMMIGAWIGTAMNLPSPGIGVLEGFAIGAIGGLLPDLDHPNSKITRQVAPISIGSRRISLILMVLGILKLAVDGWLPLQSILVISLYVLIAALSPHRGITHSLLGLALATWGLYPWLNDMWVTFVAAYISHIAADMLTDGGTPILFPYQKDFRLETGLQTGGFFTTIVETGIQIAGLAWIAVNVKSHLPDLLALATKQIQNIF